MKLRSGKELPPLVDKLPSVLEKQLEDSLQYFKVVSADHPQHAKELLKVISKSKTRDSRIDVREKIYEIHDSSIPEKTELLEKGAGSLFCLLHGIGDYFRKNHINDIELYKYNNLMKKQIETFDLESNLTGDIEMGDME